MSKQNSGPNVGGHDSFGQAISDNVQNAIKQERSEQYWDNDLDDILGPIFGDIFPLTSTPIANRSQSVTAANGMSVMEPSPIERVEPLQPASFIPRTPRRALFQESSSDVLEARTTIPTPTRQPTLREMWGTNSSQDTTTQESASGSCNRTESSPPASGTKKRQGGSVGRKIGNSAKATPPATSSKKRKKSTNQVEASRGSPVARKRRKTAPSRINDSGFDGDISLNSEHSSIDSTSDFEYGNEDDEEGVSIIRSTVPYFSIHRLPVEQLHTRFEDYSLTEIQMIELIMDEINEFIRKRYKNRQEFELRAVTMPGEEEGDESETSSQRAFRKFSIVPYVQKVSHSVPFLAKLGILDKREEINLIIFYYRENDIYAITTGSTWQAIQKYSCYDFPCQISGRLTVTEGNVRESTKPIAGNNRTSIHTKKNSTNVDNLRNIRINVTKVVRSNSSLYSLREFNSLEDQHARNKGAVTNQIKMVIGMAFVKFLTRMDLKNFPEILDHFSKICRGEDTFKYPPVQGDPDPKEKHIDETPIIRIVQGEEAQQAEKNFYELIQLFMHNQRADLIRKFDFVDKYIEDFCSAREFKLIYNNKGDKVYEIASFSSCPTALDVLTAIKAHCGDDLTSNNLQLPTFSYRLKNHVRVQYKVKGGKEITNRRVVDLLEGEMTVDGKDFWKTMGHWWFVRDHYYYEIYREFRDLLNKPGVYVPNENLTKPWDRNIIKSVQDYVKFYDNEFDFNYFLPPNQEALEQMSSQPGLNNQNLNEDEDEGTENTFDSSRMIETSHYFDLMRIRKQEDGQWEFLLFYIFNGFDAGIRDASTRIKKSIEMLLMDAPTTSTKSLLEKFWEHQVEKSPDFNCLFRDYEMFRQPLTSGNRVSIVVAFATGPKQMETSIVGPLSQYRTPAYAEVDNFIATLDREKDLRLNFNLQNVREILNFIKYTEPTYLDNMCTELEIITDSENYDIDLLTSKVLGLLMENGYCAKNECLSADKPVTGKLLKIRYEKDFKLFENASVNKKLFQVLNKFYITGFPGFIHKLECFQIVEDVAKETRLTLNFVEIK